MLPGGHNDGEPPARSVQREAYEELGVQASFHPLIGEAPLFVTNSVTRGPDSHTDTTLWFVVAGEHGMPIMADEREFTGVRWVGIDDVDAWVTDCYAPHQVARFVAELTATLRGARAHA